MMNGQEKVGPFGSIIQKDPTIRSLELSLIEKFNEIIPKDDVPSTPETKSNVRFVSFEDAIKELMEMQKG